MASASPPAESDIENGLKRQPTREDVLKVRDGEMCAICQNTVEETPPERALRPCGHKFHNACIEKWFEQRRNTCPLCRAVCDDAPAPPPGGYLEADEEEALILVRTMLQRLIDGDNRAGLLAQQRREELRQLSPAARRRRQVFGLNDCDLGRAKFCFLWPFAIAFAIFVPTLQALAKIIFVVSAPITWLQGTTELSLATPLRTRWPDQSAGVVISVWLLTWPIYIAWTVVYEVSKVILLWLRFILQLFTCHANWNDTSTYLACTIFNIYASNPVATAVAEIDRALEQRGRQQI